MDVSTGTDRASFCLVGVSEPGVDGGVKAGLSNVGGGREEDEACCWLMSRSGTSFGWSGRVGYIGDAWEGNSGIALVKPGLSWWVVGGERDEYDLYLRGSADCDDEKSWQYG